MSSDDTSYYRQRAVDERAMALAADRQNVREIHQELARQYEALVEQAELRPTLSILTPNTSGLFPLAKAQRCGRNEAENGTIA